MEVLIPNKWGTAKITKIADSFVLIFMENIVTKILGRDTSKLSASNVDDLIICNVGHYNTIQQYNTLFIHVTSKSS